MKVILTQWHKSFTQIVYYRFPISPSILKSAFLTSKWFQHYIKEWKCKQVILSTKWTIWLYKEKKLRQKFFWHSAGLIYQYESELYKLAPRKSSGFIQCSTNGLAWRCSSHITETFHILSLGTIGPAFLIACRDAEVSVSSTSPLHMPLEPFTWKTKVQCELAFSWLQTRTRITF